MEANPKQLAEKLRGLMEQIERLPASAYYWGALGSIGLSALLMLFGRKSTSIFVGLWPPTIALLGLFNKQLHPSQEFPQVGHTTAASREGGLSNGHEQPGTVQTAGRSRTEGPGAREPGLGPNPRNQGNQRTKRH